MKTPTLAGPFRAYGNLPTPPGFPVDAVPLMLAIGGDCVLFDTSDSATAREAHTSGREYSAAGAALIEMQHNGCHLNSATLALLGVGELATGWGLTASDGLWRPHSWVVQNGRIVETTEIRDAYFGIPECLGAAFSQWFLANIRPEDDYEQLLAKELRRYATRIKRAGLTRTPPSWETLRQATRAFAERSTAAERAA